MFSRKQEDAGYWYLRSLPDALPIAAVRREFYRLGGRLPPSHQRSQGALERHYERLQRGQLEYWRCTVRELKKFVINRSLDMEAALPAGSKYERKGDMKKALVGYLERQDEEVAFHHFLDLPVAVRHRIYEQYMLDFPGRLEATLDQPPLATASRQLRQESLKVFFETCTFPLRVSQLPTWLPGGHKATMIKHAPFAKDYYRLQRYLPLIRTLEITSETKRHPGRYAQLRCCVWKIDIRNRSVTPICPDYERLRWLHVIKRRLERSLRQLHVDAHGKYILDTAGFRRLTTAFQYTFTP